jgi:hypothetical protein
MPVIAERFEVASRLERFDTNHDELLAIVELSVRARGDATPDDPASAAGWFAYSYGTRGLRNLFLAKGWELRRTDNIESVYNPNTGDKIVFQNAERAGDLLRDPIAISRKGPASARAVDLGQGELWPEIRKAEVREIAAPHWYLFVQADGEDVRAELSFPKAIENEKFDGFDDRIILLQKGEWQGIDLNDNDEPNLDFDVNVTRK